MTLKNKSGHFSLRLVFVERKRQFNRENKESIERDENFDCKKFRDIKKKKVNLWPWGYLGAVRIVKLQRGQLEISVFGAKA